MTTHLHTPAEDTAAILQEAAHAGLTVMIPGALEAQDGGRPVIRPTNVPAPLTVPSRSPAIGDRERLQYELEGGGAASERPLSASARRA